MCHKISYEKVSFFVLLFVNISSGTTEREVPSPLHQHRIDVFHGEHRVWGDRLVGGAQHVGLVIAEPDVARCVSLRSTLRSLINGLVEKLVG